MTPLQPGDDRAADRDQGASPERDNDEGGGFPVYGTVHFAALSHFAKCVDCRKLIFTAAADALVYPDEGDQLAS